MHQKVVAIAALLAAVGAMPAAAWAGPCSDDIAAIGRQLAGTPQLGPPTTGALSGGSPGAIQPQGHAAPADSTGTTASANGRVGGTAGTKELDAASGGVATSPADVRRQQLGKPTAAQQADAGKPAIETTPNGTPAQTTQDDRVSRAKLAWQQAVDLNARGDQSCKSAVRRARDSLNAG